MAAEGSKRNRYKVKRREHKRRIKRPRKDGRAFVFVCNEELKEIWIHVDEQSRMGIA